MNIIKFISKLFILVFFVVSCEEKLTSSEVESVSNTNTLNENNLGLNESNFSEYYFDLNSDFNAKYFYYQKDSPVANTILNPGLLDPNRDTLNLRTFSDYILKVEPQDLSEQTTVSPFDETIGGCSQISDVCPDIDGNGIISNISLVSDIPQVDSLIIFSHQFSSILKLDWDIEDNRYKPILEEYEYENGSSSYTSQWLQDFDTIYVDSDIFQYDSLVYMTSLDTILTTPEGLFYFDKSEYIKRDSVYSDSNIELEKTFDFTRNVLSSDSIMYRVNTDCNLDGVWTAAEEQLVDYNNDGDMIDVIYEFNDINDNGILNEGENLIYDYNDDGDSEDILFEFDDVGNGNLDIAEIYWDSNSNGVRNSFEPFEDLNCNGVWDMAEQTSDGINENNCVEELNGQWLAVEGLTFCDMGNKFWDDAEYFEGSEIEGSIWLEGKKLSKLYDAAVNLLVDYTDLSSPQAVSSIITSTSVKLRGSSEDYYPIISEEIVDNIVKAIPEIDSVRTTFSNKVISQITDSTLFERDYKILKSQYPNGYSNRNYDYTILDDSGDEVVRLHYPSYFLPYGFYTQHSQIADGFWYEDFLVLKTLFYMVDGKIREGEHVIFDSVYVTSHGDYHVETDYFVERPESIVVPLRKVLFDERWIVEGIPSIICDDYSGINDSDCNDQEVGFLCNDGENICVDNVICDDYSGDNDSDCNDQEVGFLCHDGNNICVVVPETEYLTEYVCINSIIRINNPAIISNTNEICIDELGAPAFDSTITDLFSIVKTMTMTMLGSGVEFGQRTTTTLAKGLGVVNEDIEIRWSEQIGIDDEVWSDYASIALNDFRMSELARSQGILNNLTGREKISIEELNQLDGDPFIKGRSTGIQPVSLPSN